MISKSIRRPTTAAAILALLASGVGCELVADFDRTKINPDAGTPNVIDDAGGADQTVPPADTGPRDDARGTDADNDAEPGVDAGDAGSDTGVVVDAGSDVRDGGLVLDVFVPDDVVVPEASVPDASSGDDASDDAGPDAMDTGVDAPDLLDAAPDAAPIFDADLEDALG